MSLPRVLAAVLLLLLGVWTAPAQDGQAMLQGGIYTIEYPQGQESLARESLEWLREAEEEFSDRLPAGGEPVRVVICGTAAAFNALAGRFADPAIGGFARPHESLIVIKSPRVQRQSWRYPEVLRHELVHILLYRNTDTDNLPRWLNEGIAMMLAGEHRWEGPYTIAIMYMRGQIMSYPELTLVLAGSPGEMAFGNAYAQSLSMSRFLRAHLGEDAFWELIMRLDGESFPDLLREYTGWIPYDFWQAWRRSLWFMAVVVSLMSGFGLFQFAAVLVLIAWWRKRAQRQVRLAAMEAAEAEADEILLPSEVLPDGDLHDWELDNEDDEDKDEWKW